MNKYLTEKQSENLDFSKYRLTKAQAIRLKCLDCCGFEAKEVKYCIVKQCPLYPYRKSIREKTPLVSLKYLEENTPK